ncbi:shikimate kinase [Aciduricibacillus chroicocephali]|uniref:Shikimate kinase n=1 Tax=Aciduricibacillus chroicocephali TaxID=3054939 RepID=A0ABY9KS75_9BACI|nr:shikimate kinase [Bacillaceae bacterium 44XB]
MERIFLIGFMGSGKSTIGHALEKCHSADFADTDHYIEKKHQRKITDIFAEEGENYFRELETEALRTVEAKIVSTGGGIIERIENISVMKARGKIVYLAASFEEISRRLEGDASRPLWKQDESGRKALFERREPLYEDAADYIVQTEGKTAEEIAECILDYMGSV